MRNSRTHLGLAISVVGLALGCASRPESVPESVPPPMAVEVAVASLEPVTATLEATGAVHAWARVAPGTKILGRVESVPVEVGQVVGRGQLLAALEQRDLAAGVRQARAAVQMAEAQLDNAQAQAERMQELHGRGSVTEKGLEDATAAQRVALAAVEQARADLERAEVMLGYAEVRAPRAGTVTAKYVEAGDMARPGQELFAIEDVSRVKVIVDVPQSQVAGLRPGAAATVEIDVLDAPQQAEVARINPAGDATSRTFEVRLDLDNPQGRLKSGMFARARFESGSRQAMLVPGSALVRRGALDGLYVIDDAGRGRLRWVRPGKVLDRRVEILSGLSEGERYLPDPPPGFADGTPVEGS